MTDVQHVLAAMTAVIDAQTDATGALSMWVPGVTGTACMWLPGCDGAALNMGAAAAEQEDFLVCMKLRMEHVLQEAAGVVDTIAVLSGLQRSKGKQSPARLLCRCTSASPTQHRGSLWLCALEPSLAPG